MKINLNEIRKKFEFKFSIYFGLVAFVLSFLSGIINSVEFLVLIKRIFIIEIFFIPMGYAIGYLLKNYLMLSEPITNLPAENLKKETEIPKNNEENVVSELENVELENEDNKEEVPLEEEIQKENNETSNVNTEIGNEEYLKRLKSLSPKNLGKYLIIQDKKFINDPEAMAQAIKTMMNREE